MKTLIVCYSKTGNTRRVAERVKAAMPCDMDSIMFDEKAHTAEGGAGPAGYDLVILMCPVWAFSLPEPMALYLKKHKADIGRYRLVVTCGAMGLRGCVSGCAKILGAKPEAAVKIRAKQIAEGKYDIGGIIAADSGKEERV